MPQPYVGEIRLFAGNFAPAGWFFCDGSVVPISEYETLFQLIGTTYGGDGQSTFGLPDLRGRVPIHQGAGSTLGQVGGVPEVTLTSNQMPTHSHPLLASNDPANATGPQGNLVASALNTVTFYSSPPAVALSTSATTAAPGGAQPHDNTQPYLCINFIISQFGIFPSPS